MANLKIRATADVSNAKAGIRELTQEEAKRNLLERESNARRRQDYAETAKAQLQAARQGGQASKQEIEDLRRAQRVAVADQKAAVKELTAARREAARAEAVAQRESARRQQQLERFEAGKRRQEQIPEDLRREMLAGRGRVVRSGGRRSTRGQRSVNPDDDVDARDPFTNSLMSRVAGPAALIGAVTGLVGYVKAMAEEVRTLRKELGDGAIATGQRIVAFRKAAAEKGMSEVDIRSVIEYARGTQDRATTSDYLDSATAHLSETNSAPGLIQATDRSFAQTGDSPEERAARGEQRVARLAELNAKRTAVSEARRGNVEALFRNARLAAQARGDLDFDNWNSAKMKNFVTMDSTIREQGYSGPESFMVHEYNAYADGNPKVKKIEVELSANSIRQLTASQPLLGE